MNAPIDRMPPHDLDAERAVISGALLTRDALEDALALLEPEHFYPEAHRRIWEAARALRDIDTTVDILTVKGWLQDKGRLDQVGGTPYLAELVDCVPSVASVETYAQRVHDKWRLRVMIATCQVTTADAYAGDCEIDSLIGSHSEQLDAITQGKRIDTQATLNDAIRDEVRSYDERKRGATPGIPTGLRELDRNIGGLKRGNMYVVAARPGIGKTGFAVSVALNVAGSGLGGVAFISLEMPRDQLTQRAIAQQGKLDTQQIEQARLSSSDFETYTASVSRLQHLPIVIDDEATQSPSSVRGAVRRALRRLRKSHPGINLALIVVDYLQIMTPSGKNKGSRENDVTEMSGACRKLAKEFYCPVLALSQLNREVEKRPDKRPILADLRESGAIEQDAFGVLMLYRDDYYRKDSEAPDGQAEVLVRKLRQGGSIGSVRTAFHDKSTSFSDLNVYESHDYFDGL